MGNAVSRRPSPPPTPQRTGDGAGRVGVPGETRLLSATSVQNNSHMSGLYLSAAHLVSANPSVTGFYPRPALC